MATAAVATVVAVALAVAVSAWGGDPPAGTGAKGTGSATAQPAAAGGGSPSASPSRSFPPNIDPCLLGRWRVNNTTSTWMINGVDQQTQGLAGEIQTFREDGTVYFDDTNAAPQVAVVKGVKWESWALGNGTLRYAADMRNGELQFTVIAPPPEHKVHRAGKFYGNVPGLYLTEPAKYTCSETSLTQSSTLGKWTTDATRIP